MRIQSITYNQQIDYKDTRWWVQLIRNFQEIASRNSMNSSTESPTEPLLIQCDSFYQQIRLHQPPD